MKKNYIYIILIVIAGVIAIPILSEFNMGIPCMFNKITGLYCPGCGLTRAAKSIMNLDFKAALGYNTVGVILIPVMFIFWCILEYKSNKDPKFDKNKYGYVWYIFLFILIAFGILRNIPVFSFLAPH